MIDQLLIVRKVAMLREHLGRARRRRPPSPELLQSDVDLQDALALSLLVAIQEAVDIALHVAADEGWGVAASYAEAFEMLAAHGVIDAGHARELGATAAVRNRIAHGYATVDSARLWAELPAGLDALERYASSIARHVESSAD